MREKKKTVSPRKPLTSVTITLPDAGPDSRLASVEIILGDPRKQCPKPTAANDNDKMADPMPTV